MATIDYIDSAAVVINAIELFSGGDSLGSGATQSQSVPGSDRVEITLGSSPTLFPGSSVINIKPNGTKNIKDEAENRVSQAPVSLIVSENTSTSPTLVSASYNDVDMDGTMNAGDTVICTFDRG